MLTIEQFFVEAYTLINVSIAFFCCFALVFATGYLINYPPTIFASFGFFMAGACLGVFGVVEGHIKSMSPRLESKKALPRNPYSNQSEQKVKNPYARYELPKQKEVENNGMPQGNDNFSSEVES